MHRLLALLAALSVGLSVPSSAGGTTVTRHCVKTFSLEQFHRAARSTYRGRPSLGEEATRTSGATRAA